MPFLDADNLIAQKVFAQVLIFRAEFLVQYQCVEYLAVCPAFANVPLGCMIPHYHVEITEPSEIKWRPGML